MDFQQSFYFLGTLFMGLGLVILITLVIFLVSLEMRIKKFKRGIEEKIHCGFITKTAGYFINRLVSSSRKTKK